MTTDKTAHRWRQIAATSLAAGAFAAGALALTAPAANAQPIGEKTIKSECKDAGGTYSTAVKGNQSLGFTRFSACTYKDNEGNPSTDYYANGEYYGTA
jgi:hypothetical protein